jgi:hypothetical protein
MTGPADGPHRVGPALTALWGRLPTAPYDDRPEFEEESYAAYGQVDWKITASGHSVCANHDG